MDARVLLQCADCLKQLDEFIELSAYLEPETIEALTDYTLFLEMNRLKKIKIGYLPDITNPLTRPPFNNTPQWQESYPLDNTNKIIC